MGRGVYIHEADKKSKNKLGKGKWTAGLYLVIRDWTGGGCDC